MLITRFLYVKLDQAKANKLGPLIRSFGQSLINFGEKFQGYLRQGDRIVPSLRSIPYKDKFPKLLKSEFIAPNATIIGNVNIESKSSIYFGAVLRGENCSINIQKKTTIQDNTQILNSSKNYADIEIGQNVLIGTNCYIDNSKISANCVIGNNASLYSCEIGYGSMVAAGAVVVPGTKIPANQIWVGNPAKYLRDIQPIERENIDENKDELVELSNVLAEETEKNQHELVKDALSVIYRKNSDLYTKNMMEANMKNYAKEGDERGIESHSEGYYDLPLENVHITDIDISREGYDGKFEHDYRSYPDYFKIYRENYARYEEINRNADNIITDDTTDIFIDKDIKPLRSQAMRAWVSKWDSDFNNTFKNVGSKSEFDFK